MGCGRGSSARHGVPRQQAGSEVGGAPAVVLRIGGADQRRKWASLPPVSASPSHGSAEQAWRALPDGGRRVERLHRRQRRTRGQQPLHLAPARCWGRGGSGGAARCRRRPVTPPDRSSTPANGRMGSDPQRTAPADARRARWSPPLPHDHLEGEMAAARDQLAHRPRTVQHVMVGDSDQVQPAVRSAAHDLRRRTKPVARGVCTWISPRPLCPFPASSIVPHPLAPIHLPSECTALLRGSAGAGRTPTSG